MTGQKKEGGPEIFDLLERLEKRINSDPQFSKKDEESIHEMLQAYKGLLAVGKLSKFFIFGLAAVAASMAAYKTIITGLKAWLLG